MDWVPSEQVNTHGISHPQHSFQNSSLQNISDLTNSQISKDSFPTKQKSEALSQSTIIKQQMTQKLLWCSDSNLSTEGMMDCRVKSFGVFCSQLHISVDDRIGSLVIDGQATFLLPAGTGTSESSTLPF